MKTRKCIRPMGYGYKSSRCIKVTSIFVFFTCVLRYFSHSTPTDDFAHTRGSGQVRNRGIGHVTLYKEFAAVNHTVQVFAI